jgi:hypothetical protein
VSIKEMFVDYYELLSTFRCQRVDSLKKALEKNGIDYMEDTAGRPIVLRSELAGLVEKDEPKVEPEFATPSTA